MKRKILSLLLVSALIMSVCSISVFASDSNIKVFVDEKEVAFDVFPTIVNGRTLVPLRAIFESLGAKVEWISESSTVKSTKDNREISLTINDDAMYVDGNIKKLDVSATLIDGRTLVPVRAISEAFDCNVEWIAETKSVIITSKSINKENIEENENSEKNLQDKSENDIIEPCVIGKQYTSPNGYGVTIKQAEVKNVKGVKTLVFDYTLENLTKDKYLSEKTFFFGFTDGTYSNQGGIHLDGMYPGEKLTKTFNLILQDKELSYIMFDDSEEKEDLENNTNEEIDFEAINERLKLISGKMPRSYFETRLVWYFEK